MVLRFPNPVCVLHRQPPVFGLDAVRGLSSPMRLMAAPLDSTALELQALQSPQPLQSTVQCLLSLTIFH